VNRILDGSETKDSAIAVFADTNAMVLITENSGFRDSHFVTGTPACLLHVTLGNLSNTALLALFDEHWEALAQVLAISPRYLELGVGVSSFSRCLAELIAWRDQR
jgi:predicted nuclease of predicted toxin-antitoxin system